MATHKELSNFTHDRLSKCNHIDLEIAELKASLTVKQSNQLVPQAIFDKIKDLCIKLSVVIKQDALTILAALTFLEQLLKKSNVILSQAIEILENIKIFYNSLTLRYYFGEFFFYILKEFFCESNISTSYKS